MADEKINPPGTSPITSSMDIAQSKSRACRPDPAESQGEEQRELNADLAAQPEEQSTVYQELEDKLKQEVILRQTLEEKLQQTSRKHKAAVLLLNKLRTQDKGFFQQLDDNYLIGRTNRLRLLIRNFAIEYYQGKPLGAPDFTKTPLGHQFLEPIVHRDVGCMAYLESHDKRPILIEAFLWNIIVGRVFHKCRWAGNLADAALGIYDSVRNANHSSSDEIQRIQRWAATTTGLITSAQTQAGGSWTTERTGKEIGGLVGDILSTIGTHRAATHDNQVYNLHEILSDAIMFDLEICRQVALIEWVFPLPEGLIYDPMTMVPIKGEESIDLHPNIEPCVVVKPGMNKRGRSTGDSFDTVNMLLPLTLSYGAPPSIYPR
ncbi:hypothetical protein BDW59DRAFT_167878 [Aspergillus cavernicola]|uniref:Uncharacterized protein n=1 Tax=Aspergillus cavernicola TaxID=176166 RepID=A0ABR4HBJ2_9EURO